MLTPCLRLGVYGTVGIRNLIRTDRNLAIKRGLSSWCLPQAQPQPHRALRLKQSHSHSHWVLSTPTESGFFDVAFVGGGVYSSAPGVTNLNYRFLSSSLSRYQFRQDTVKTGQSASAGNATSKIYPHHWTVTQIKPKYRNMATLESLNFDNLALRVLPIDPENDNFTRQVSGACFSKVKPTPVTNPHTVAYSASAMSLIDLPESELERPDFAEYFSGNKILKGADTAAHCYCGHQFGNFAGQLGDGATMYVGEVVNKMDERWEIQFKGAGLTPYSRTADGRKVLRSSIREFLCSEAIHHLGIATTRAGTCVTSDTKVIRDIYYTGNPIKERATVILRIAPTFIRFGSFEIFKDTDPYTGRKGPSVGRADILEQLLDYTVRTFYPEIWEAHANDKKEAYLEFYKEIVRRTALLVAEWQCVGWCHGVLNTDNMSIVGLTIDYGPYGFMDRFERGYTCNGSDDSGRYAYEKQPEICKWNLGKLAEALAPLIGKELTEPVLETYDELYEKYYTEKMMKKLGLISKTLPEDKLLIESFLDTMEETGADMTNSFRILSEIPLPGCPTYEAKVEQTKTYLMSQCCTLVELRKANAPKMDPRQLQMFMMLAQMNPGLIDQLGGSASTLLQEMERIEKTKQLKTMTIEKKAEDDLEKWTSWLSKYSSRLQEEAEGCEDLEAANQKRVEVMNQNNPKFVLRNYIAQNAISAAEEGDFIEVRRVLKLLENPYSDNVELGEFSSSSPEGIAVATVDEAAGTSGASVCPPQGCGARSVTGVEYNSKPPSWAADLTVT